MARIINICFVLLFAIVQAGCDTSGNVDPTFKNTFIRYYGSEGDQVAADLLVNADGTILILGNSISLSGSRTSFLTKVNVYGDVIWERNIGAVGQTAVDVEPVKSSAGDVIVALNYDEGSTSRVNLVKVTEDGTVSDPVPIPLHGNGGSRQIATSITSLQAGEFVLTGLADGNLIKETWPVDQSNDRSDIMAFRLNSALEIVDTVVTKGGEQNGCGVKTFEMTGMNEGKLVLFSYTDRPFSSNLFGYNFSFDILNSGIPVGKLIGTENDQELLATAIEVPFLNGGGYLMAGTSRSVPDGPGDIYLVKYDEDFQQRAIDVRLTLQKNLTCVSAENASSGFYILANEQPEGALRDITLLKVTRGGEFEWSTSFGTRAGDDASAAVASLPDGRVAILGTMQLQTKKKVALIVVNADGRF